MSTLITTPALVVHTRRWSDSSKIVQLFTPRGMVSVIAKGALRPKSEFRGVVEVLNEIEAVWSFREKRGLQILTGATLLRGFHFLKTDLEKTAMAYAMLEVIQKVLHDAEAFPALYTYVVNWLVHLEQRKQPSPIVFFWHFLLRLSAELGFALQLEQCQVCHQPITTFPAYLDVGSGRLTCQQCGQSAPSGDWFILEKITYQVLLQLLQSPLPPLATLPEQLPITEILLKHLQYHTDIPLQLNALKWLG